MELAAAKLAISTLSPIINKLGSFVYDSYLGGDVTAEEMRKLTNVFLPKIKMVLQEAESVPLDKFRRWLEDLEEAAFEAEDLIDLYEYKKIKDQVSSLPESVKKLKNNTRETLRFMLPKSSFKVSFEKLQKSAEEAENLLPFIKSARRQLKDKNPQASTGTRTGSALPSCIFGREKECDIVIKFLLEESHADSNRRTEKIPIIAIKGIGGSGKTTTAQSVYNDERVQIFDLKMWVHVSRSFDVHRLTKEIIESAVKDKCPHISNLDVLQTKLKESIPNGKKFLLVLDDIWCEDKMQWDQLLSPLNGVKGNGNKIIITTRMEKVTSILHVDQVVSLQELKMNDCWSILKHYAFDDSETTIEDMELENVGNQIIRKVKYSPLALKVVGSSLYKQVSVNEWENIFRKDILKGTMDVLFLSFQHLPSHLQRCFAYCSLFPKGYKFYMYKEEYESYIYQVESVNLIPLWIAQGFVENTNENEMTLEEKGQTYIKELLSYSFFEMGTGDYNESYFKIHDLLHDLAEMVSKKYCHRIEDGSSNIPPTCIHLSVLWPWSKVDISDMLKLNSLRTLLIVNGWWWGSRAEGSHVKISPGMIALCVQSDYTIKNRKVQFSNPTKLRALYVQPNCKVELVLSGNKLKHLRFLNLKYDEKLHRSLLAKLYHLQFLYCHGCPIIKGKDMYSKCRVQRGFVQGFENLINLRTLKLYDGSSELDYCDYHPELNIRKLTSLQNLTAFRPKKDGVNGMMPLKNLNLHGSLSIRSLEQVKSEAEAAEAMLNKKKNLKKLKLEWSSTVDDPKSCKAVLEGLEPHPNLESLSIEGYQGVKVPDWMINGFTRLLNLYLIRCESLEVVPCLPPRLQELYVEDCHKLMQLPPVGDTLRTLLSEDCSKLMPPSMSNKSLSLTDLCIRRCARNESQLFNDLPFLTNLEKLRLEGFSNLQTFSNLSSSVNLLDISDFPNLTILGNLQNCTSLNSLQIKRCPMLMRDESIFVDGDITLRLPCSLKYLELDGSGRQCPLLLEENLHHLSSLHQLWLEGFTTLPSLEKLSSLQELDISDSPNLTILGNLQNCTSLVWLRIRRCPMLMRDESIFVDGDFTFRLPCSVKMLTLDGSGRQFPLLLEEILHHLSSLVFLTLEGFTTLPSLEKLSSLENLRIKYCPDVELLPSLPISLRNLWVRECPNLKANYEKGGPLHNIISHIPFLDIY